MAILASFATAARYTNCTNPLINGLDLLTVQNLYLCEPIRASLKTFCCPHSVGYSKGYVKQERDCHAGGFVLHSKSLGRLVQSLRILVEIFVGISNGVARRQQPETSVTGHIFSGQGLVT